MIRVCPKRDAVCPYGITCPFAFDRYRCAPEPSFVKDLYLTDETKAPKPDTQDQIITAPEDPPILPKGDPVLVAPLIGLLGLGILCVVIMLAIYAGTCGARTISPSVPDICVSIQRNE